jgi:Uncharacterized conserved protein
MYFVIRKNKDGLYWFREVGDNNTIVAVSQLYTRKESAQSTIAMIKREAATAPIHDKSSEDTERNLPS